MEITLSMLESYGRLRANDESLSTAIRCEMPQEITQFANQLLEFTIPEFSKVVPEVTRERLTHGNSNYLDELRRSAQSELDRYSSVNVAGLNTKI